MSSRLETGRARKIRRKRGHENPTSGMRATFGRQPTRDRCLVYRESERRRRKDAKPIEYKFLRSECISSRSCSKQSKGSGIEMLVRLAVAQVGRNYESWAEKPAVEERRMTVLCSWLQLSSLLTSSGILGMEETRKLTDQRVRRGAGMRGRYERGEMQIQMGNARRGNMRDRAAVRW